jgi:hypothetical protein
MKLVNNLMYGVTVAAFVEAGGGPARAPFVDAARGDYERARLSGLGQKDFAHVLWFLGGEFSK